jgi:hypothetical protein
MALQVIPTTPGEPYYSQTTRLDGRDYLLRFSYNQRLERWFLDLHDEEGTPLVQGLRLIANWSLLRSYQWDERIPQGKLFVGDVTGDGTPPTLNELGTGRRCQLYYQPAE